MKILHNPDTLLHVSNELLAAKTIPAHECPARITSILDALRSANRPVISLPTDMDAAEDAASKLHSPEYLAHLKTVFQTWQDRDLIEPDGCILPEAFPHARLCPALGPPDDIFARVGYYAFDMSTGISKHTYQSAIASADLARRGAAALVEDPTDPVMVLSRPPGHHCGRELAGGYCYLNNMAVAVQSMLESELVVGQIGILDLDFHHGNGTQSLFYDKQNPAYVSLHGAHEFPYYTGTAKEIGEGEGKGYNLNLPLPGRTELQTYLEALEVGLEKLRDVRTEWLVVSLGFDTFRLDVLGNFCLDTEDYRFIARRVGELGVPTLLVLEGGYNVEHLGHNVVSWLKGFEEGRKEFMGTPPSR